MSFEKYLSNTIGKIKYIIIKPKEDKYAFITQSYFNKFSNNIINSIPMINFIAYLPSTFQEYLYEWPYNINNNDIDCKSEIIYISDYDIDESDIDEYKHMEIGCIFLLDNIDKQIAQKIKNNSNIPVITSDLCSVKGIEMVYKKWNNNVNNVIRRFNKSESAKIKYRKYCTDKSKLKGIKNPENKFLFPLNLGIDKMRGLQQRILENTYLLQGANPKNIQFKEKEADELIVHTLKEFICEKFITLKLGFIQEESFDNNDEVQLKKFNIKKNELEKIINNQSIELYEEICNRVYEKFYLLDFSVDMVLVVPSINYNEVIISNEIIGRYNKKIIDFICNEDSYYGVLLNDTKFVDKMKAIRERAGEKVTLDLMNIIYALPMKIPFIRTRNIPSVELYSTILKKIEEDYINDNISELNKNIERVSGMLKDSCSNELWEIIDNHCNNLKVISDMPIEWVKINNMPLCVGKRMSRIPITPGNGLISHSYLIRKYECNKENLKIMLINTLENDKKNDRLNGLSVKLRNSIDNHLKLLNKKCVYKKINTKNDFINALENEQPTVLIYYGHGEYNEEENEGALIIGNEQITASELEEIIHKPLITILGACQTEVSYGSHLNIGNLLIGSGCVSVIATHMQVRGSHAASFISELIRNLVLFILKKDINEFEWNIVIHKTYISHYILDVIIAMEEEIGKDLGNLKYMYEEYYKKNNIKNYDIVEKRNIIFNEILRNNKSLYNCYLHIKDKIIPLSTLYISLGSPEKILFVNK